MSKFIQDFSDLNYLRGVVDTTLNYYEAVNADIDSDKDLFISYEPITDSKTQKLIIGYKISFTWIIELKHTRDIDDHVRDDDYLKVYSKDKLTSVISDLESKLSDIDSSIIIK